MTARVTMNYRRDAGFDPYRQAVGGSRARSLVAGPKPEALACSGSAPQRRPFWPAVLRDRGDPSRSARAQLWAADFLDLEQKSAEDTPCPSSGNRQ